jgi:hypothetical protein
MMSAITDRETVEEGAGEEKGRSAEAEPAGSKEQVAGDDGSSSTQAAGAGLRRLLASNTVWSIRLLM